MHLTNEGRCICFLLHIVVSGARSVRQMFLLSEEMIENTHTLSDSLSPVCFSLLPSLSLQHEDFLLALQVNEDEYKKVGSSPHVTQPN